MNEKRAHKPRVVEFVGLPGCGKTTVAKYISSLKNSHALSIRLASSNEKTRSKKEEMLFMARRFVPCAKILFYLSPYVVSRSAHASTRVSLFETRASYNAYWRTLLASLKRSRTLLSYLRRMSEQNSSADVVIFEHGPINVFWLIDLDRTSDEKLQGKLIREIHENFDIEYVYFDVNSKTASQRIATAVGRARTPFDCMSEAERRIIFERNVDKFRSYSRILEDNSANCLVVDAERSVEEKAEMILSWLSLNREDDKCHRLRHR